MKRIWSALVCFLLALSLCVFEIIYTTRSADELGAVINSARAAYGDDGGSERAVELLNSAARLWSDREGVMNMFLYHDKVDELGALIKRAESLARQNSDGADAEMTEALETLEMIKKAELPSLENIL